MMPPVSWQRSAPPLKLASGALSSSTDYSGSSFCTRLNEILLDVVIEICHVVAVLALSALAMVPVGNVLSLFRTASSLGHWLASLAREQGHACGARKALAKAATTNERTAMERNIAAIQDVVTWAQMHQTCLRNPMKQICMNIATFKQNMQIRLVHLLKFLLCVSTTHTKRSILTQQQSHTSRHTTYSRFVLGSIWSYSKRFIPCKNLMLLYECSDLFMRH